MFSNNKKGAITMGGIATVFLELVMFVMFLPQINILITDALPYLADSPMAMWFIKLIPLTLVMAITFGVFNKNNPNPQGG